MEWYSKNFNQLDNLELYQILQERLEIFILEQHSIYQDIDNIDIDCQHIFAKDNGNVVAYCRIVPKGKRFPELSIGRVIIAKSYRKQGLGLEMMERAIAYVTEELQEDVIRISAQAYLLQFYESLGFRKMSEEGYQEDGILHYAMIRNKNIVADNQ